MNCPYVMRKCRTCGEVKFLFKFVKNKNSKYGFEKECGQCRSKRQKKYKKNKKEITECQEEYKETPQRQITRSNSHNKRIEKQVRRNGITELEMMFFELKCAYKDIDHIMMLDNGGLNEIWEYILMYRQYDSGIQISDILEWYQQQDFYSEERLQKIYEWQKYVYDKWGEVGESMLALGLLVAVTVILAIISIKFY